MPAASGNVVEQLIYQFVFVFFLFWGVVGVAVGGALVAFSARMIEFLRAMNRSVSTRRGLKAMAMPHDFEPALHKHKRWIAAAFIAIAAFACYGLITLDVAAAVSALQLRYPPAFVAWIVETLKWVLVAGSLLVGAVGIMLGFFPDALRALESRANRWVSTRQIGQDAETMHLTLDRWVEAHPRVAGAIICIISLVAAVESAIMLF